MTNPGTTADQVVYSISRAQFRQISGLDPIPPDTSAAGRSLAAQLAAGSAGMVDDPSTPEVQPVVIPVTGLPDAELAHLASWVGRITLRQPLDLLALDVAESAAECLRLRQATTGATSG